MTATVARFELWKLLRQPSERLQIDVHSSVQGLLIRHARDLPAVQCASQRLQQDDRERALRGPERSFTQGTQGRECRMWQPAAAFSANSATYRTEMSEAGRASSGGYLLHEFQPLDALLCLMQ